MSRTALIVLITVLFSSAASGAEDEAWLQSSRSLVLWAYHDRDEAGDQVDSERVEEIYEEGTDALSEDRWDDALASFDKVAAAKFHLSDGATYWKAYSLYKLGRRAKALEALTAFREYFGASRWSKDAKTLEVEIRQASGQSIAPEIESDDELKLVVINGLMNTDPERAVPLLEKVLGGSGSPKLKEHALFVLSQSGTPKAREILGRVARGGSNPDLQVRAVEYIGLYGGDQSGELLAELYASSLEAGIRRKILSSFMLSGDHARLLEVARTEKDERLRGEAVQQLGLMGDQDGLRELYKTESSVDLRKHIIEALFLGGAADVIIDVVRTEKNSELRLAAIQQLGLMGQDKCGDALVSFYSSDRSAEEREAILSSLWLQGNVDALVAIARAEKDPAMKKSIVEKLSLMGSDKATEYMIELLGK